MEAATWVLAVFTGVLAISTIAYTIVAYKLHKGSAKQADALEKQVGALEQLTKAVLEIPIVANRLDTLRQASENQNRQPPVSSAQQRAVTGKKTPIE